MICPLKSIYHHQTRTFTKIAPIIKGRLGNNFIKIQMMTLLDKWYLNLITYAFQARLVIIPR